MKGTTSTGFKFDADENIMDDVEFLERLAEAMTVNGFEMFPILEELLGKDGKKALYEHVRNEKGKVSLDRLNDELGEILSALSEGDETKN